MVASRRQLAKRELILVLITLGVLNFAVFRFGYMTYMKKTQTLVAKMATLQTDLNTAMASLQKMQGDRAPSSSPKPAFDQYLQQNTQFTALVKNLSANEKGADFEIKKLATEKAEKVEGSTLIAYTMSVQASYLSLVKVLDQLEKSPLIFAIKSLEIYKDSSDVSHVNAKIMIHNLVAKE